MFESEKTFLQYIDPYRRYGEKIQLKIDHSLRVRDLCAEISCGMGFSEETTALTAVCGLYHDIGRFEQWRRYQTFNDSQSVDHGDLGAEILCKGQLIRAFSAADRNTVIKTTRYHNKYMIPGTLSEKNARITKIIRDADKMDILFLYASGELMKCSWNTAMNDAVYQALLDQTGIRSQDIRTKADRIAVYLAFVFDLNFPKSFELVKERGYIDKMIDLQLSEAENARLIEQLRFLREYLDRYLTEKTA